MKRYIRQSWQIIRQNPVLSSIGILGTAFAICMVMVLVQQEYMKVGSFSPETNRSRWLVTRGSTLTMKDTMRNTTINMPVGDVQVWEIFRKLKTPEAVTTFIEYYESEAGIQTLFSVRGNESEVPIVARYTDEAFWRVFDFSFVAGKHYTESDARSNRQVAVITDRLARKFFGSVDEAIDKQALINGSKYTVCGVVRHVTPFCSFAYGDVWMPLSSLYEANSRDRLFNDYAVICLAKSPKDFDAIKEEIQALTAQCNAVQETFSISFPGQPANQFATMHSKYRNDDTVPEYRRRFILLIILFLCIPAINLSGMTLSRMRRRLAELGVRRSFGAVRSDIIRQVIAENMLLSLLGGVLGLGLSYLVMAVFPSWLLPAGSWNMIQGDINGAMFNPIIFLIALFFCVLINLLSAFVPAWRISKTPIVESLSH
ncbi:ABC transporter permease [Porphyromonas loveana]|uniref:Putative ABC transport system permease protein n=1 Tax=Porphyromonas loveana TaxID=1884669 RepID=A0A2U1FCG9_9PORP|nr:ABC transporter permease [Porphyromonas loveana]PVZ09872.1 putative ABC transport system permease protein [Porphyromonas loveana]